MSLLGADTLNSGTCVMLSFTDTNMAISTEEGELHSTTKDTKSCLDIYKKLTMTNYLFCKNL